MKNMVGYSLWYIATRDARIETIHSIHAMAKGFLKSTKCRVVCSSLLPPLGTTLRLKRYGVAGKGIASLAVAGAFSRRFGLLQVDMTHTVNQFYFDEIPSGGEAPSTITCPHDLSTLLAHANPSPGVQIRRGSLREHYSKSAQSFPWGGCGRVRRSLV